MDSNEPTILTGTDRDVMANAIARVRALEQVAAVGVVVWGEGDTFDILSTVPPRTLAALLRAAAESIEEEAKGMEA